MTVQRRLWALLCTLLCALLFALPARAEGDYETVLNQLERLQTLAQTYANENEGYDPIVLTLAYTRTGDYNTTIWQLTAGTRDPGFESYVAENDGELSDLQEVTAVALPNGQVVDFGHLLASMNLVYNGVPITGSWGGDCMQLAQVYAGQASDAAGYAALMAETFNINDDGTRSKFGDQDLRADLDSINIGARLQQDANIAALLRDYYTDLTDYTRAYTFIAHSFGTVDTGNAGFADTVYNTLTRDTGMQLLLYMNGMWSVDGWTIDPDHEAAVRGACTVFANYLAGAVSNERVRNESGTLMVTMASDALAAALNALGDSAAASAALSAGGSTAASTASSASGVVDEALNDAAQTIRSGFNVNVFQTVLLVLGGAALLGLLACIILIATSGNRKTKKRRH